MAVYRGLTISGFSQDSLQDRAPTLKLKRAILDLFTETNVKLGS